MRALAHRSRSGGKTIVLSGQENREQLQNAAIRTIIMIGLRAGPHRPVVDPFRAAATIAV
jgi:hypothetical protein